MDTEPPAHLVAFIGWFGPRGLASIVFALLALEELQGLPGRLDEIVATISLTVLLSVLLHGLTAQPLAGRHAATHRAEVEPVERPRAHTAAAREHLAKTLMITS